MLDFTGSAESLGKPALSDMQQGLATAPTLFAADQFPQIREMITRRFAEEGDVATAPPPPPPPSRPHSYLHPSLTPLPSLTLPPSPSPSPSLPPLPPQVSELVAQSDGMRLSAELATSHAQKAKSAP